MSESIVRFAPCFSQRAFQGTLAAAMLLAGVAELGSETVTLTTYYPAPSGVYAKMITTADTWLARDGGSVGIGTGAGALEASAGLEIVSTSKGLLGPRMTSSQRDAIPSPAAGLLVYNTDKREYDFYDGTDWKPMGGAPSTPGRTTISQTVQCNGSTLKCPPTYPRIVSCAVKAVTPCPPDGSYYNGANFRCGVLIAASGCSYSTGDGGPPCYNPRPPGTAASSINSFTISATCEADPPPP